MPSTIFISHAAADSSHCQLLERHLASLCREHLITLWHHRMVHPGEDARVAIRRQMEAADLVLLLVTPDFLASDECNEQTAQAMARHRLGAARVVPILVRPVDWHGAPFAALSHLPPDGRAITRQPDHDEAWEHVAREIRSMVARPSPRFGVAGESTSGRPRRETPARRMLGATALAMAFAAAGATLLYFRSAPEPHGTVRAPEPRDTVRAPEPHGTVRAPEPRDTLGLSHLLWAPADCGQRQPMVGYRQCSDLRGLPWLQAQLNLLKRAEVQGFADLPVDAQLDTASSAGKENWLLFTTAGGRRVFVSVGYQHETRSKDGCLRLYDAQTLEARSATVCLDEGGRWWTRDENGTYRAVGR
ncbi:toll/interleukin-1 receptor domain-containing protein [Sorangium sp. So ce1000]|uniref:toll/interleukin-1 receptor domain-containing protein n=1 Tax=Sorangium sp. So ce1000 TaxID=3133325 RepID=UPI003F60A390